MDFDRDIRIVNWNTSEVITTRAAVRAYQVMGRTERWDGHHASSEVRTLHSSDAAILGVTTDTPVTFQIAE
jgi:hypothetical protein